MFRKLLNFESFNNSFRMTKPSIDEFEKYFCAGTADGYVKIWDMSHGNIIASSECLGKSISNVVCLPSNRPTIPVCAVGKIGENASLLFS